jgi:signal transduction histidine kinase
MFQSTNAGSLPVESPDQIRMLSQPPFATVLPPGSPIRHPFWLSVLSALFGFGLRLTIDPWLGNQMPYITFLVAVALAGLFAGVASALLSTGLGAALAYFCFVPPRYHWGFQGTSDAAGFFSYLAAALCIVLLTAARKKAYRQAEQHLHEQVRAQGKLRDAEKMFQLFMDNRPGFSYLRERKGQYAYFNSAARRVLGPAYEGGALPEAFCELQEHDEEAFKSGGPRQFVDKIVLPAGEQYWLTTKFTFSNEAGQSFVGSVSADITDQMKAEAVALERERLFAATRMMATVAHEVNNPLAAVTGSVHLLSKEQLAPRARELADIAQLELSRLAHITRLALGFYQNNEPPIAVDPCDLVREVLVTLSDRFSSPPDSVTDFAWSGTFAVPVRQIHEALENVLINSFESGATRVRVRVRRSTDWGNSARSGCRISVIDDGRGMGPEHRKHAFEPFFSTKPQRGRGLGLWVSNAIVLKNGGLLSLRTTEDSSKHGTCVSIFLPNRVSAALSPGISASRVSSQPSAVADDLRWKAS